MDQASENGSSFPSFRTSPLREKVVGEVHARPFRPITSPRTVLHYAFLTHGDEAAQDHAWLADFCVSHGGHVPAQGARHHTLAFGGGTLSWEQHAEFTTYTWDGAASPDTIFGKVPATHPFGAAFRAPGDLLVAVRLELRAPHEGDQWRHHFDGSSLTVSTLEGGAAVVATDFRQDGDGLTRFLVFNHSLNDVQAGAVVQRLLEVETYRTLAMLGLFEATGLQPDIRRFEIELADLTGQMKDASALGTNQELLDKLTTLAAALEAGATASTFRFGASRAYDEIVKARLSALREEAAPGDLSMAAFLTRRLAPAMRTCQAIEDRQAMLSRKLARATTLLRTSVDVELEEQNRILLQSMNRRARLQLRLQQTVEGLSVAAVSYYVVGLISYLAKAAKESGLPVPNANVTTGLAVPLVVLLVWWLVRRIRKHHGEH
ncbi:DUF3422 family protein [Roseibium salinum]|uniref:DUF3422 domain-containing protein n=1 Tax=Roseibium salinum TaxID=1604349 RepID=A0ABT3R425_9HYPH|nr:DUF3422 domain-containing protein [Roseibium sp. DSM 29163]MCX2723901.1 DUF3422 domain-containing protein [Roseibium sp. DSM 29163]